MKEKILKGIAASPGKITGEIYLVKGSKPDKKFKKNSILVTKITNPTMVLIMSKSIAIVTDKGGILSHPAIVSRELGIPCVTSTKKATKILKTGMKIKVDGDKGKVYYG
ncbi:Prodigiosin synthesizing transferase PigC [subsurface metagenome]